MALDLGETHEWSLLTGAGFSANWGLPTALVVWSEILSHPAVDACASLREALLDRSRGFNFEAILFDAQHGRLGEDARAAMDIAVQDVYDRFATARPFERQADTYYLLQQFLIRGKTSFVFTLNQDMLLESLCNFGHGSWVGRPAVIKPPQGPSEEGYIQRNPEHSDPHLRVSVEVLEREPERGWPDLKGGAWYIKLHGSYDWLRPDGTNGMVLGGGKEETIKARPLLSFYSDIFTSYITSGGKRLLIMGYGFGDGYLNQRLARAVKDHGLRIAICEPRPPGDLGDRFWACGDCQALWKGLCGYSTTRLSSMRQFEDNMDRIIYPSPDIQSFVASTLRRELVPWSQFTTVQDEFGHRSQPSVAVG